MTKEQRHSEFLGVYVAPELNEYLSLWAYASRTDKSKKLRKMLMSWYTHEKKINTENKLINDVVKIVQVDWNAYKDGFLKSPNADENKVSMLFDVYKPAMHNALKSKGIKHETVERILNKIKL